MQTLPFSKPAHLQWAQDQGESQMHHSITFGSHPGLSGPIAQGLDLKHLKGQFLSQEKASTFEEIKTKYLINIIFLTGSSN